MNEIATKQVEGLLEETDQIAALSNLSAWIYESYDCLNWAGFYLVKNNELVLGPFQGKVACTHIPFDRGVCGLTYRSQQPQRIRDVLQHKDHIACDANSRSELCVPIVVDEACVGMIDLDAPIEDRFTQQEEDDMVLIASLIANAWKQFNW